MAPPRGEELLSGQTDDDEAYWRSRSRPRVTPPTASIPVHVKAGVTLSIALTWVLTTELAKAAQDEGFGGYTLLYVSTSMLSLFHCKGSIRAEKLELRRGGQLAVDWAVPGFLVLWLACNLAFLLALTMDRATTVTAVFSTNPAFVYVLSVIILREPHDGARIFAVILAIGGVYLTTTGAANAAASDGGSIDDDTADGDGDDEVEDVGKVVFGSLLALASAALAAMYKVMFYFVFGETTPTQVSSFLGSLGLMNLATGWVLLLILWGTGNQDIPSISSHPRAWVLAALYAFASAGFNFSVNLGVARTYPLFVSLGTVLGIPFAVVADCSLAGVNSQACSDLLQPLPLGGYAAIALAFALLLMRDRSFTLGRAGAFVRDARTGRRVERVAAPPGASIVSAYSNHSESRHGQPFAPRDEQLQQQQQYEHQGGGGPGAFGACEPFKQRQHQHHQQEQHEQRGQPRSRVGGVGDSTALLAEEGASSNFGGGGDTDDDDDEEEARSDFGGGEGTGSFNEAALAAALLRSERPSQGPGASPGTSSSSSIATSGNHNSRNNNSRSKALSPRQQDPATFGFKALRQVPMPPHSSNTSSGLFPRQEVLRVAFVGNSYLYYNDLPRLLEVLVSAAAATAAAGPAAAAVPPGVRRVETASCLRGGASVPELLRSGGRRELVGDGDDAYGWQQGGEGGVPALNRAEAAPERPTVRGLLLGGDDVRGERAPGPDDATTRRPCDWDFVVVNDYSQQAAVATGRLETVAVLESDLAPLLCPPPTTVTTTDTTRGGVGAAASHTPKSRMKTTAVPVLYVPPAYRKPCKGSLEAIGEWGAFTARQEEGYEHYRRRLDAALASASSPSSPPPPDTRVASVNAAYAAVKEERAALWADLFADDDYHPSPAGSFLAACVLYATLLRNPPLTPQVLTAGIPALMKLQQQQQQQQQQQAQGAFPPPFPPLPKEQNIADGDTNRAAFLFSRSRRPLSEGQPSTRLPTAEEMLYLLQVATRQQQQAE